MAGIGISRHYVLAAGGTGGHMVPAHALAEELIMRGHHVALITDDRGARIPGLFENVPVHILPAGRLSGGPIGWAKALKNIFTGRAMASRMYETFRPSAVIGFGGYPALPSLLAAQRDGIPTLVHEQNAVLGRVNRLLAGKVDAIATAYASVDRLLPKHNEKVHLVGNPVRDEVLALASSLIRRSARTASSGAGDRRQPGRDDPFRRRARTGLAMLPSISAAASR
jgi:UDP-N-acetylglucosamine--N-acetylmuramyl-(pentapeptide) pyrophosphoryl-undecaprenol N-acetylglucosamine transferase